VGCRCARCRCKRDAENIQAVIDIYESRLAMLKRELVEKLKCAS
jgi:hypothetical protein